MHWNGIQIKLHELETTSTLILGVVPACLPGCICCLLEHRNWFAGTRKTGSTRVTSALFSQTSPRNCCPWDTGCIGRGNSSFLLRYNECVSHYNKIEKLEKETMSSLRQLRSTLLHDAGNKNPKAVIFKEKWVALGAIWNHSTLYSMQLMYMYTCMLSESSQRVYICLLHNITLFAGVVLRPHYSVG